ncbi:Variant-specific surface protein, partial [Giardia duodenalis]
VNDPAGVSIDSLCRPVSSPQAIAAGCAGKDGAALTDSSTAREMCSGRFFLFRGGCYSQTGTPGSEICTAVSNGECTACATADWLFTNPADPLTTPGTKCLLCSDATGDGTTKGVENCNTCQAPSSAGLATCSACQEGYYRDGNACQKCDTSCATCSGTGQNACTSCPEGKYLKGNTCAENCGDNTHYPDPVSRKCMSCSAVDDGGIEGCTACTYNTTVSKPQCTACGGSKTLVKTEVDGTTTCVDAAGCAALNTLGSHFLSQNSGSCILCSNTQGTSPDQGKEGCSECKKETALTNAPVCSACLSGYTGTDTCTKCADNCATCSEANNENRCLTCMTGYFPVDAADSQGKKCVPCDDTASGIEGCATCTFSGSLTCNSCKPNYKASGTKSNSVTCTKACEDETACGGTAGACGAIVVGSDGSMKYYCSHCGESTKFPIDGICKSDKSGNTCDQGVCTSCTAGYFLYMGGCYKVDTEPGSLMCTAAPNGICTTPTGQYFKVPGAKATDQSVLACGNPLGTNTTESNAYVGVEGCKTCEAPTAATGMAAAKCTACDEGKILTGSGYGCVTCSIAGCSACRADNMCEVCSDGHRLEGEACVSTGGGNLSTGAIAGISVTKSSSGLCC